MKTPRTHTLTVSEYPRVLLWISAAIAMAVTACSNPPPPQQSAPSVSAEQTPPQAQVPASVPQDSAGVPPQPASEPQAKLVPAPAPAPAKPRIARLKAGQMLTIRTTRVLSTKTMDTGDVFSAILEEPITVDDWVVVPAGARVDGRIVEADDGGRLKGKANISIELTSLTTSAGQKVDIVTTPVGSEAATKRGKDAAKVGIGAGAGAAIGAIAGGGQGAAVGALVGGGAGAAMRGAAAEIPAESVVSFELRSPVTIQEKK